MIQASSTEDDIESRLLRLEIGVQSVYEDVARDTNRGHTVRAVCESFQQSKDAGFKVREHLQSQRTKKKKDC